MSAFAYYYQQADALGIDELTDDADADAHGSPFHHQHPKSQSRSKSVALYVWLTAGAIAVLFVLLSLSQSPTLALPPLEPVAALEDGASDDSTGSFQSATGLQSLIPAIVEPAPHSPTPYPHRQRFDWCWDCKHRCDNILTAIEYHARNISVRDRSYKYREIAASLPRFFRGLDHLFLQDVFNLQRIKNPWYSYYSNTTRTIINADMHMFNYGSFHNNRNEIVYDMNDFDQTLIGDYHIDLWRTSTSVVVHMDVNHIDDDKTREKILHSFAKTYLRTLRSFVGNNHEMSAYLTRANTDGPIHDQLVDTAKNNNQMTMLETYCYYDRNGVRRLDLSRPDLEIVDREIVQEIINHWPDYLASLGTCRRNNSWDKHQHEDWTASWQRANVSIDDYYAIKSIAGRVGAGLGSLGQPRYYILIEGPSLSQDDDILLDMKREPTPEWWHFIHPDVVRVNHRAWRNDGHRICSCIHALGTHVDSDVGYLTMNDGSYIVRTRSPWKGAVDVDGLTDPSDYKKFTDSLAVITAINHARSDDDYDPRYVPYSFEQSLVDAVGDHDDDFAQTLADFAQQNAKRIAKDFACYVKSGLADQVP